MPSDLSSAHGSRRAYINLANWGTFWLAAATVAAGFFFFDGIDALLRAWSLPEYSHGPLIPVLSLLLFLRQLKTVPENHGPVRDRWVGVVVVAVSLAVAAAGKLANIDDIIIYATIIWVGGILLISFGWSVGKHFWPPVLHLVYMLPLPDTLYFKMTNSLQLISSELGVWFLRLFSVPVFLEGNIIDLGVLQLHVADACSGLRYLFPILSFSYIFAVLYRGPMWHKAILLISAVPITILMNSVRIAIAGVIANTWGVSWLEGFTHFFEGWVVFIACILLMFLLAWVLLFFNREKMSLTEALDLETDGLGIQAMRLRLVRPSAALITAAGLAAAAVGAWQFVPERGGQLVDRDSFAVFPRTFGEWQQVGPPETLAPDVERALRADDYHQVTLRSPAAASDVGLFMAWYQDQSRGGVHSPEICLPGSGWEIAWLERTDVSGMMRTETPFMLNRAIIERGTTRMMVYYWFQQGERRVAWDMAAKFYLMLDGIRTGETDGAIVRLTTLIGNGESEAEAEARLQSTLTELLPHLPRFIPED
ncbi:VPLPA-CTERM-specific exosortase XrtD [Roseibacterium sp. SDUM158017]|uniref:VPLPA-CTERM-specific exosortase XrtD n=1 Tax=Roseicyclus salinarum TaxID=3036773 RepID=UPI0024154F6A|nr:VPLPA-CTERM-specific exosortase XrtD [Roseibacterium sp. SDUM158017]MDG4649625.1 VPLPA-CTERM-specific exosortase XrtD [Roseibacterium sp. SDUM158017]